MSNAKTKPQLEAELKAARRELNQAHTKLKSERRAGPVVRSAKPTAKSAGQRTRSSLASVTTFDEYLDVLVDPENAHVPSSLQVPGLLQVNAVAWKNKWEILVRPTNQEAVAVFRPGLAAAFAASSYATQFSLDHPYMQSTTGGQVDDVFPGNGNTTMTQIAAGPLAGTWAVNNWDSIPEASAIVSSMVAVQPIAASMSISYSAAPLNATGRLLVASIPGGQCIAPGDPISATECMGLDATQPLSYDQLITLNDAVSTSVLDGGRCIFVPSGVSAQRFRPTKYANSWSAYANAGSAIVGLNAAPPCDGDPSRFMAFVDSTTSPSSLNNFYFDQAGAARTAAQQRAISINAQQTMARLTDIDCPTLVFFADGLQDSATFKITFTQVMCGIADSRSWSLSRSPSMIAYEHQVHEDAVQAVIQAVPKAMSGATSRSISRSLASRAKDAYHFLVKKWDTIAPHVPAIANSVGNFLAKAGIPEVGELMADIGSAGSLAEVAGLLAL